MKDKSKGIEQTENRELKKKKSAKLVSENFPEQTGCMK